MRTRAQARRNDGFTLIEVITTIAVMVLIMPPIVQGFKMAADMSIRARNKTQAIAIAQSKMDELMAEQPWVTGIGNMGPEDIDTGTTVFSWRAALNDSQQAIDEEVLDIQELTLTVSWAQDRVPQELVLTTDVYVSETPIQTFGGMP